MADLITFVLLPNTNTYAMFAIPLGRIYTNVSVLNATEVAVHSYDFCFLSWKTLLDTLLTRESLRTELDGTDHVSGAVSCVVPIARWSLIFGPCIARLIRLGSR